MVAEQVQRDRRRRAVAGSVLVAAVAALIITPQLLNKTRTADLRRNVAAQRSPTASSETTFGSDPLTTTPCPEGPIVIPKDGKAAASISGEATSIRLCRGAVRDAVTAPGWSPPRDALSGATPSFVESMQSLPADRHRCAVPAAAHPYVYLVGLPTGSVDRVYVASPCDDVTVNGVRHTADTVLAVYLRALAAQR